MKGSVPETSDDEQTDDILSDEAIKNNGNDLQVIDYNLDFIVHNMKQKVKEEAILDEWRVAARILDRFLFWITFIITLVIVIYFLTRNDGHH